MDSCINNDKFHTISLKMYSVTEIIPEEMTLRILLISYMQLASLRYKTEEEIVVLLESLYDFTFNVRIDQIGKYHFITFLGNAINPKYIKDEAYTIDLIFKAFYDLSTPLTTKNGFDLKTFQKAKRLLMASLEKDMKYPDFVASNDAIKCFFNGTLRDYDAKGSLMELKKITCKDLYNYYLKFQMEEKAMFVLGDFESYTPKLIENTITLKQDVNFYDRSISIPNSIHKKASTEQTYLRIIYDTNTFTKDPLLKALSIINYCLGGSSYSHLFKIVREKYGLCYSIDSDLYGASGILMIQAEIQRKDLDFVLLKIDEAIDTLLDSIDLPKVKKRFILTKQASYDQPEAYFSDAIRKLAFQDMVEDNYEDEIMKVTMDDLSQAMRRLKNKRMIYTYGGDQDETK